MTIRRSGRSPTSPPGAAPRTRHWCSQLGVGASPAGPCHQVGDGRVDQEPHYNTSAISEFQDGTRNSPLHSTRIPGRLHHSRQDDHRTMRFTMRSAKKLVTHIRRAAYQPRHRVGADPFEGRHGWLENGRAPGLPPAQGNRRHPGLLLRRLLCPGHRGVDPVGIACI